MTVEFDAHLSGSHGPHVALDPTQTHVALEEDGRISGYTYTKVGNEWYLITIIEDDGVVGINQNDTETIEAISRVTTPVIQAAMENPMFSEGGLDLTIRKESSGSISAHMRHVEEKESFSGKMASKIPMLNTVVSDGRSVCEIPLSKEVAEIGQTTLTQLSETFATYPTYRSEADYEAREDIEKEIREISEPLVHFDSPLPELSRDKTLEHTCQGEVIPHPAITITEDGFPEGLQVEAFQQGRDVAVPVTLTDKEGNTHNAALYFDARASSRLESSRLYYYGIDEELAKPVLDALNDAKGMVARRTFPVVGVPHEDATAVEDTARASLHYLIKMIEAKKQGLSADEQHKEAVTQSAVEATCLDAKRRLDDIFRSVRA